MIFKELELYSGFRGLPSGYKILFNESKSHEESCGTAIGIEPICLVGLNGSGKSNVLEVISEIFYYLEIYHRADKYQRGGLNKYKTSFGFLVRYILPREVILSHGNASDELINILRDYKKDPLIKICKNVNEYPELSIQIDGVNHVLVNNDNDREAAILPARVIGYSSGMNELMSNPFIKMDFQYFDDLENKTNDSLEARLDMNRLFFMDYDSNKYITICNFMFDAKDFDMSKYQDRNAKATDYGGINLTHIRNETNISDLSYFSFTLKLKKPADEDYEYLPTILNQSLDKFKACASFCYETESISGKYIKKDIRYDFWVNKATKEAFRDQFSTAYELFRAFYFLHLLNIKLISSLTRRRISNSKAGDIDNLSEELPKFEHSKLSFRLHNIKLKHNKSNQIEYRKLSDGEHQLLQVLGTLLLMDTSGALFLLDEPETHFNPDWRSKLVNLANKSIDKSRQQELFITTHSPYIISDCRRENVFVFSRHKNGKIKTAFNPEIKTFGTSVSIIADAVFNKSETLSDVALKEIERLKSMPMNTIDDIQQVKEASRILGESPEKVLLFREILLKEKELKDNA